MRGAISIISLSAIFAAGTAQADVLGATFGAGGWSQDPGGWVQYDGEEIDLDDDLDMENETGTYAYAKLEHPVPILPNLRLYYGQVSSEGDNTISRSREFGGVTYSANERVRSEIDMDYIDGTLYYEVLDNVVSADLGLNVRYMSGSAKLTGENTGSEEADFDIAIPMIYAMLRADIPTTGLFLKGEGAFIGYGGNRLADVMLGAGYEIGLGAGSIGIEAGYKSQQIKLDDVGDVDADMTIKGPYAGVVVDF